MVTGTGTKAEVRGCGRTSSRCESMGCLSLRSVALDLGQCGASEISDRAGRNSRRLAEQWYFRKSPLAVRAGGLGR